MSDDAESFTITDTRDQNRAFNAEKVAGHLFERDPHFVRCPRIVGDGRQHLSSRYRQPLGEARFSDRSSQPPAVMAE
jgi:hypothetical protein